MIDDFDADVGEPAPLTEVEQLRARVKDLEFMRAYDSERVREEYPRRCAMERVVAAALLAQGARCTSEDGCGRDAGHGRACPESAAEITLREAVAAYRVIRE